MCPPLSVIPHSHANTAVSDPRRKLPTGPARQAGLLAKPFPSLTAPEVASGGFPLWEIPVGRAVGHRPLPGFFRIPVPAQRVTRCEERCTDTRATAVRHSRLSIEGLGPDEPVRMRLVSAPRSDRVVCGRLIVTMLLSRSVDYEAPLAAALRPPYESGMKRLRCFSSPGRRLSDLANQQFKSR